MRRWGRTHYFVRITRHWTGLGGVRSVAASVYSSARGPAVRTTGHSLYAQKILKSYGALSGAAPWRSIVSNVARMLLTY